MATRLRFDIGGLVALGLEHYIPRAHKADGLTALCLSPTLVHHIPRLTVLRDDVNLGATTLPFALEEDAEWGDRLVFEVQGYNLTVNAKPSSNVGLTLATSSFRDPIADQGVAFGLIPITAIPWMATLAGHGALRADCAWPVSTAEVTTALRLTSGVLHARLLHDGPKTDPTWEFWDGAEEFVHAPWKHTLEVADRLVCQEWVVGTITIDATPRTGAAPGRITFLEDRPQIVVTFRHDCSGLGDDACKGTNGGQFGAFYDLLDRPARRPQAKPRQDSDSGYCPPALFWS